MCYITEKNLTSRSAEFTVPETETPLNPEEWKLFEVAANKPRAVLPTQSLNLAVETIALKIHSAATDFLRRASWRSVPRAAIRTEGSPLM